VTFIVRWLYWQGDRKAGLDHTAYSTSIIVTSRYSNLPRTNWHDATSDAITDIASHRRSRGHGYCESKG